MDYLPEAGVFLGYGSEIVLYLQMEISQEPLPEGLLNLFPKALYTLDETALLPVTCQQFSMVQHILIILANSLIFS